MSSSVPIVNVSNKVSFFSFKNKKFLLLLFLIVVLLLGSGYYFYIRPKVTETYESSKPTFTMFYADWCGHSQTMLPVFDEMKKKIEEKGLNMNVEKIDCEKDKEKCKSYRVTGYPTLLLIKGDKVGDVEEYSGDRSVEHLVQWCEDRI